MENILTDTRQLERDNTLLKTELENRIEDLAKQNKAGGDNRVSKLDCSRPCSVVAVQYPQVDIMAPTK